MGRTILKSLAAVFAIAIVALVVSSFGNRNAEITPELAPKFELPESETQWLWELEHRANILGQFGFSRIKDSLTQNDRESLLAMLSMEFQGTTFEDPATASFNSPAISAVRKEASGTQIKLPAAEFVDRLTALRSDMDQVVQCSIGVKQIGPIDREHKSGRWSTICEMGIRGTAGRRLIEVTTLFKLESMQPDKDLMSGDGWILGWSLLETSQSQSNGQMFDNVTDASGIDVDKLSDNWESQFKTNNPGGLYACDFNRDGHTDFLVTDVNPVGNSLYQGIGKGKFADVTDGLGLRKIRRYNLGNGNALFVDLNNDGWVDLLHTEGVIWENQHGKGFRDVTSKTNLLNITNRQQVELKSVSVADFDRDGLLDLFVVRRNEMPVSWLDEKGTGPQSMLCRNLGNWKFRDVTKEAGTTGHDSLIFTTAWLDANNDNWPDLAVINEFGDSFLYINQQDGRFEYRDLDPNKSDFGSMGLDVGDVNNDGLIDLYIAGMYSKAGSRVIGNLRDDAYPDHVMDRLDSLIDGSELYRNAGELKFTASGQKDRVHNIGWSWGPSLADFNNDGWLDLYAPSGYMSRDRQKPDG